MDWADEAQEIEEAERARALRLALGRTEAPRITPPGQPCLDCGEPIPAARLAAQPNAQRCAPCQGLREARAM